MLLNPPLRQAAKRLAAIVKKQKMKQKATIFLSALTVFILTCSFNANSEESNSKIRKLLPEGTYFFEVLDSVEVSQKQIDLTEKFKQAYQNNMEILNSYFEKTRNNEVGKFPDNIGITESEFKELMDYANNIKLLPSGKQEVTIKYSKNKLSFKSKGKLEILNYLEIDLEKNTVSISKYLLPFRDSTVVTSTTNALQESWKGDIWEFVEPKDINMPTTETIKNISVKRYKFTLGTLDNSKRTFMIIKGQEFANGVKLLDFEIPMRMKE